MTDCATRLAEAKMALHNLQMGEGVVSVSDNGIMVTYTQANIDKLSAYVSRLEAECGDNTGRGRRGAIMFRG
ncbi:MAG: gpW family head-tail joining protein [Candidatus Sedimenticola sp. (ex Thyasira tokunagai)]